VVAAWSPTPEKQTVLNQRIAQHIDVKILYAQYAKQSKVEPASPEAWMTKHPVFFAFFQENMCDLCAVPDFR
jgi:hypothetical protein